MRQLSARPVTCPVLIGRREALDHLEFTLESVGVGQGQTLLISGEAGVGKSRLVAELKAQATRAKFLVVQGHCFEPDRPFPYAPLLDVLRGFLSSHSPEETIAAFGSSATELVRLLPDLEAWLPGVASALTLDPAQEKRRTFLALERFLVHLAALSPVLIVIEDLHWSDETSLEFLLGLARRVHDQRLLLVITYRNDEVNPALAHLLASFERERLETELKLNRLNLPEVDAMLRATLGQARPVPAEMLHLLYTLTEGNPFFLEEVLKSLVLGGEMFDASGVWKDVPLSKPTIPRSVHEAVQRRSAALSPAARHILELAAAIGQRFEFAVLCALTRLQESQLLHVIKDLIAAQLVVEISAETFAFRHALTRQAIYSELLARERRTLHLEIAGLLETRAAEQQTFQTHFEDLAYHFFEAGAWEKALEYATQAAQRALALYAPQAALEQFTRALEAAGQRGMPAPLTLFRGRGQAHSTLGEFEAAMRDFETALELARQAQDLTEQCLGLLVLGGLWAGRDYRRSGSYFQAAIDLAQQLEDTRLYARCLNRFANWLVNTGSPLKGVKAHLEALSIFEALDDHQGIAETLDPLGMGHAIHGDLVSALACFERAIEVFRAQGDQLGLVNALCGRISMCGPEFADIAYNPHLRQTDCAQDIAQAYHLTRQIGWLAGEAWVGIGASHGMIAYGEFGLGLAYGLDTLRIASEIEHQQWITGANANLGQAYVSMLSPDRAIQHLEAAIPLAQGLASAWWIGMSHNYLAMAYLQKHDLERAQLALEVVLPPGESPRTLMQRRARLLFGELCLLRNQAARALEIVQELLETAPGERLQPIPTVLKLKADALLALSHPEQAIVVLEVALHAATELEERRLIWVIHRALGQAQHMLSLEREAAQEFAAAHVALNLLAATITDTSLREHFLQTALETLPVAKTNTTQSPKEAKSLLTTREREVVALIALGLSNKKIAQRLEVSERTVTTHVTNILGKLEMNSRAQVIAWAHGH